MRSVNKIVLKGYYKVFIAIISVLVLTLFYGNSVSAEEEGSLKKASTIEEAADYLREQMIARNGEITFLLDAKEYNDKYKASQRLKCGTLEWNVDIGGFIGAKALAYSDDCTSQEGDALIAELRDRIICSKYKYSEEYFKFTFNVYYYTNAEQEAELNEAVKATVQSLELDGKTEFEKIKIIHDYVNEHVKYDRISNAGTDYVKYSAYSALINGKAEYKGYAALYYRLCKEAGLSVRIISGQQIIDCEDTYWNIVEWDNVYYNVDCYAYGDNNTQTRIFFMKSDEKFESMGYRRDDFYDTSEFHEEFPMSVESWEEETNITYKDPINLDNLAYTFTTVDDTIVSSTADGKPKLLVFWAGPGVGNASSYSISTIKEIAKIGFKEVDILAICTTTDMSKEEVIEYRDTYCNDSITFCYDTDITTWRITEEYSRLYFGYVLRPMLVYIDSDNKIQFMSRFDDPQKATDIRRYLKHYCGYQETMTLSQTELKIPIGTSEKLEVYYDSFDKNEEKFIWTSSNEGIATVDIHGRVTGLSLGNAVITATAKDGSGLSKSCIVTVAYTGLRQENGKWIYVTGDVKDTEKNGLVLYGDSWFYVKNGEVDTQTNGFVDYENNTFYVASGQVASYYSGLVQVDKPFVFVNEGQAVQIDKPWYFLAEGQYQKGYNDLALYDGHWFLLTDGVMQEYYNGLYDYDGGRFLIAAGQLKSDYSGLYQDKNGDWYFLSEGQVCDYSGLALYDGAWFYIEDGMLAVDYSGYVEYDGHQFWVEKGQVV